jgi:hypothetical protein
MMMNVRPRAKYCRTALEQFASANQPLEGTLKKLALVASAATALVCAASLIATPADAKRHHHKKPAAAAAQTTAYGPGPGPGYNAGPRHENGGPIKSGNMCFKDTDSAHTQAQFGYWEACPKK